MKILTQGILSAATLSTAILSTALVVSPSLAQDEGFKNIDCKKAKTQLEMNYCGYQDFKAADAELNRVYQQLRSKYKGSPQDRQLVDAQLAWIKFRDTDCKFSADRFKGGSIAPLIYSGCQSGLTKERTRSLKNYLAVL